MRMDRGTFDLIKWDQDAGIESQDILFAAFL